MEVSESKSRDDSGNEGSTHMKGNPDPVHVCAVVLSTVRPEGIHRHSPPLSTTRNRAPSDTLDPPSSGPVTGGGLGRRRGRNGSEQSGPGKLLFVNGFCFSKINTP